MPRELIKEIPKEEIVCGKNTATKSSEHQWTGRICLIRTYSAGVHFGELVTKKDQVAVVRNCYRIHYWAKACSLSQLAMEGDKDISDCRIAMPVNEIELDRVIEVIPMTDEAYTILTSNIWKK